MKYEIKIFNFYVFFLFYTVNPLYKQSLNIFTESVAYKKSLHLSMVFTANSLYKQLFIREHKNLCYFFRIFRLKLSLINVVLLIKIPLYRGLTVIINFHENATNRSTDHPRDGRTYRPSHRNTRTFLSLANGRNCPFNLKKCPFVNNTFPTFWPLRHPCPYLKIRSLIH